MVIYFNTYTRLSYEDRLKVMDVPITLEDRQEGDLITLYKLKNNMEKIDRQDLISLIEVEVKRQEDTQRKSKVNV